MALHIKDADAEAAVRKLARQRGTSLTETVRVACEEALTRDRRSLPVEERLAELHAKIGATPDSGVALDKKFYDDLWGEEALRDGTE